MPNLNKVMLMGNLTRDPEIKYTPKGTAIASFGLAINRTYTPEGGEKREEVTFIDLEAWGRTAEVIGEYFKKGKAIYVEGRLKLDQWEDKTTQKKMSKLRVVVESFEFLGGNRDAAANEEADANASRQAPRQPPATPPMPPADPDLDVQAMCRVTMCPSK